MTEPAPDPLVTKHRVTMRSITLGAGGNTFEHQAVDYVRPDFLDEYVADARARWQSVEISDEPDAGPAGYDGATWIPAGLAHPDANTYYPATDCTNCTHAPEGARVVKEN